MRCALCLRSIKLAYYEQCGKTYGPTCGKRLGVDAGLNARLWNSPITKHKKLPLHDRRVVVQDGQIPLFKEMA